MRPLCVIGTGRISCALSKIDPSVLQISARDTDYINQCVHAARAGAIIFVLARDSKQSPEFNLQLLLKIGMDLSSAGVPTDQIFYAGSYTVENPLAGPYQLEKRALEAAVCSGEMLGRVLRLPIVRLGDQKQRSFLAELASAAKDGIVDDALLLPLIQPSKLRSVLGKLPADCSPVEVVHGELVTIAALIEEWAITPASSASNKNELDPFVKYTERKRAGETIITHYERQVHIARLR